MTGFPSVSLGHSGVLETGSTGVQCSTSKGHGLGLGIPEQADLAGLSPLQFALFKQ